MNPHALVLNPQKQSDFLSLNGSLAVFRQSAKILFLHTQDNVLSALYFDLGHVLRASVR